MQIEEVVACKPDAGPVTDEYFGGCPKCGQTNGYRNIGSAHLGSCVKHKTKWFIGENLFSCWREETQEIWDRNAEDLEAYELVLPIYPPDPNGPPDPKGEVRSDERSIISDPDQEQIGMIDDIIAGVNAQRQAEASKNAADLKSVPLKNEV